MDHRDYELIVGWITELTERLEKLESKNESGRKTIPSTDERTRNSPPSMD